MEKSKKKKLWIMAGAPGSGKSTWIWNHLDYFSGIIKVVSRDAIRFSLLEKNDDYFSKENEVWKIFINDIKKGLKNYDNVIADATHLNHSSRGKLLRALGSAIDNIEVNVIFINTCLAKCLQQNEKREGLSHVPRSVVRRMFYGIEMPTLEEGFDNIFIYTKVDEKITYTIIKKEMY